MPELAEVEYYRKQWDAGLGSRVTAVLTHPKARIFRERPASAVESALEGRRFEGSQAHGKQMLFGFSGGAWLGLHLGMSGKLRTVSRASEIEKADHLVLDTSANRLVFSDYRMFGKVTVDVTDDGSEPGWWRDLPPGILAKGFTKKRHAAFLRRFPRTPIKTQLLDQRGYPGIGNWMADEICWRARIAPATSVGVLEDTQIDLLWKVTRQVARDALRVIATDWGIPPRSWLMGHRWKDGGSCPRRGCGGDLVRARLRGRTTCWCPRCQS